ncbi:MAG: hypothetical protein AAF623_01935 [Planctomycetota bacterium]
MKKTFVALLAGLALCCCSFNVGCTGSTESVVSPEVSPPKEQGAEEKSTGSVTLDEDDDPQ